MPLGVLRDNFIIMVITSDLGTPQPRVGTWSAAAGSVHKKAVRALTWALLVWIGLAITASCVAAQASGAGSAAVDLPPNDTGFVMQILSNIFRDSRALLTILEKPEFALTAFVALNVIVVVETGLLIGFFLPGDSLLVIAGMACFTGRAVELAFAADKPLCVRHQWVTAWAMPSGLSAAGPKIFNREKSWFFNNEHLLKAHAFYEKHGGKTIILARFMPIIRTFALQWVVAGRRPDGLSQVSFLLQCHRRGRLGS